jgi:hypothetical protein
MYSQTVDAASWWAQPRQERTAAWIAQYQTSLTMRHRLAISQIVGGLGARSLLEIGCHCGPNLIRLAMDHPSLVLAGFDVNADAIAAGKAWVQQKGFISRIRLDRATFPKATEKSTTGCVDVVLSCYTLAYVAPADIDASLYEVGRLAARAVILAEPMTEGATEGETFMANGYHEWAHRFTARLPWIQSLRGCHASTVTVSPPVDRLKSILILRRES